jgi:hypothetical protein
MYRNNAVRLKDGADAIKMLSDPDPETLTGLEARLQTVMAGALALQSTDDLGSKEANAQAWSDMLRLEKEGNRLHEKINALKASVVGEKVIVPDTDAEKVQKAIDLAVRYGGIDGDHHKAWVIDQMVRVLAGEQYEEIVRKAKAGKDGPETYGWNEGVAP